MNIHYSLLASTNLHLQGSAFTVSNTLNSGDRAVIVANSPGNTVFQGHSIFTLTLSDSEAYTIGGLSSINITVLDDEGKNLCCCFYLTQILN